MALTIGLIFPGSANKLYESCNENFLKVVEMIEKYYPVMAEHFQRIQKNPNIVAVFFRTVLNNLINIY
jgi:hypothetical protein